MNIESLAKKIEEAFTELTVMIEKLNGLSNIVEQFKNDTKDVLEKYVLTINPTRIAELRENSKKALNQMVDDIKKIDNALSQYDVVEHQLGEQITNFYGRINKLEQDLQMNRKSLQEVDSKLLRLIKEAEKNQQTAQKRFQQASQVFEISTDLEKYDELIKLQRENNRMLKDIVGRIESQPAKPFVRNNKEPFIPKVDNKPYKQNKKND